jgi:hypothetical protein
MDGTTASLRTEREAVWPWKEEAEAEEVEGEVEEERERDANCAVAAMAAVVVAIAPRCNRLERMELLRPSSEQRLSKLALEEDREGEAPG